jgi:hypothetical protein
MPDSPTARGYGQGSDSYNAADVAQMQREREREAALKWNASAAQACTCKGSPFGMDVDRCPVHGEGCA